MILCLLAFALFVLPAAAFADGDLETPRVGFRMPSGNIECYISEIYDIGDATVTDGLSCDAKHLSARPKREDGCVLTGYTLNSDSADSADENCGGGVLIDSKLPVLAYGATWTYGKYVCRSSSNAVVCRNPHAGFLLSRNLQMTF